MRKKAIIAFAAILILLFLPACAMQGQKKEQELYGPEYRQGVQGLRMSFVQNLPPARLFDSEPFVAVVQVENMGAFTVGGPGDKVYLSGFDPTIITGITEWGKDIPLLEGKSQFVPTGSVDTIDFRGSMAPLRSRNIDKYPLRLLATACYEYETTATANVCIDPNPYETGMTRKICTPAPVSLGGGQGAPIAVTLVEMDASPGRTRFKIHIQNAGAGDVFRYGGEYLNKCSPFTPALAFDEIDYVELVDVMVSGMSIKPTCKPLDNNHIRLSSGRGVAFCEFTPRGSDAYTTPMTVTLRYGYRNTIFKDVQIVSVY